MRGDVIERTAVLPDLTISRWSFLCSPWALAWYPQEHTVGSYWASSYSVEANWSGGLLSEHGAGSHRHQSNLLRPLHSSRCEGGTAARSLRSGWGRCIL